MTHIQTGSQKLSGWNNIPRKRSQPEILAWGTCQIFFMNFFFLFSLVCLFVFLFSLLVLPMISAQCFICCLLFIIRQCFLRVDDKLLLNQIIKIRELQWNRVRAVYDELKWPILNNNHKLNSTDSPFF